MKWISALLSFAVAVMGMGCTIRIEPIPMTKVTKRGGHARSQTRHYPSSPSSRTSKHTVPTPPDESHHIKETWWIENYKKLEAAHGDYTISDDARIEPLPDGRFKVTDA